MTAERYTCLVVFFMLFLAVACSSSQDNASGLGQEVILFHPDPIVSMEVIQGLQVGQPLEDVEQMLGGKGRHQFTYLQGQDVWIATFVAVQVGSDPSGKIFIPLLFKNQKFEKFYVSSMAKRKEYPYRSTVASQSSTWSLTDFTLILDSLVTAGMSAQEVHDYWFPIHSYHLNKDAKDPGFGSGLAKIMKASRLSKVKKEAKENIDLCKKYDGHLVTPAMPKAEVVRLFGNPQIDHTISNGLEFCLFGQSKAFSYVPGEDKFYWVGVFFEEGKATTVLSEPYLNSRWKKGEDLAYGEGANRCNLSALPQLGGPASPLGSCKGSQQRPGTLIEYPVRVDSVDYTVDTWFDSGKEVVLVISTTDPTFMTPEGVGMLISPRLTIESQKGEILQRYKECSIEFPSGWRGVIERPNFLRDWKKISCAELIETRPIPFARLEKRERSYFLRTGETL